MYITPGCPTHVGLGDYFLLENRALMRPCWFFEEPQHERIKKDHTKIQNPFKDHPALG